MSYPIAVVDHAFFEDHGVVGLPVDLLLDEEDTVIFATTVSGQAAMLEMAIRAHVDRRSERRRSASRLRVASVVAAD